MSPADPAREDYEPSKGVLHGVGGVASVVVGGMLLEDSGGSDTLVALGLAALAAGWYLLVTGAVARGVQLGRG